MNLNSIFINVGYNFKDSKISADIIEYITSVEKVFFCNICRKIGKYSIIKVICCWNINQIENITFYLDRALNFEQVGDSLKINMLKKYLFEFKKK